MKNNDVRMLSEAYNNVATYTTPLNKMTLISADDVPEHVYDALVYACESDGGLEERDTTNITWNYLENLINKSKDKKIKNMIGNLLNWMKENGVDAIE